MPDTAFVSGKGLCPSCGAHVLNGARCQWGVVPGANYDLGSPVVWLRDDYGQVVRPFTLSRIADRVWRWNCGDPQYLDVILFDEDVYTADLRVECPICHLRIAAGAVVVRDGQFQELLALSDADVDRILGLSRGKANIVIVRPDGTFWPREDWYDHTVEYVG